ncbi:MAG TPA: NADAR family protein [Candidatus Caenarcaniphilales bacterium]
MTIYFYKVSEPYGCFSNFSPHSIQLQGEFWPTAEHYYQAQKFAGTEYEFLIKVIQQAKAPEAAAALGRNPNHRIRADWEQRKNQVMHEAVLTKFLTHLDIQAVLLATRDEQIVENSPTDAYWGCGLDKSGRNQLGKVLMNVRYQIRSSLLSPCLH